MMGALQVLSPARRTWVRVTAGSLFASAGINAVGVIALAGMFAGFALGARSQALVLGRTNDILGLIGAALMAPAVLEIHRVSGPERPVLRLVVAIVGIAAIAAIVVLQYLLISERLTFEQQVGPVMVGYLAIAVWFVVGGWAAARAGAMPHGARLGAIAASYVGQPLWAVRWGRRLLEDLRAPELAPTAGRSADPAGYAPPTGEQVA